MDFRVLGLSPEPFRAFFGLPDAALAAHGIERHVAETMPGYPDRIALADAPMRRVRWSMPIWSTARRWSR
jgi:hypothetical protein